MAKVSSTPTVKHRRKFERIESSNINDHDTSLVNHTSAACETSKLSECLNKEPHCQLLPDRPKEFTKKCFLQEENASRRGSTDPLTNSSVQKDPPTMNKVLLYVIAGATGIMYLVGSILMYITSKYTNRKRSDFLYMSDIVRYYPESSIFALYMNIVGVSVFLNVSLRHLITLQFLRDCGQERIESSLVRITLLFGLGSCLSSQIVGAFPSINSVLSMHFSAVASFFIFMSGYMITQTRITYHMINMLSDQRMYYIRSTTIATALITAFLTSVTAVISWLQFDGEDYMNWNSNDGGWIWHVISVIGEWLYALVVVIYIFSFVYEYRLMTFHMPVIKLTYMVTKEKKELLDE